MAELMPRKEQLSDDVAVWLGDCRDCMHAIGPVDVVLTDPPYGQKYRSGHATEALWAAGDTILNDDDPTVRDEVLSFWAGSSMPRLVFGTRKVKPPLETRTVLIWDKGPALGMGALDLPWKPSYEEIYVLGSGFVGPRDQGSVIYCPPVQSMARNGRLHPNQKPVTLLAKLLQKCPGGVVLDPFMGSGSTGEACIAVGRHFIGIEETPEFFEIAVRRLSEILRRPRLSLGDLVSMRPEPAALLDGF